MIINRPGGPNVYDGVLKDYVGDDVTPINFLNILQGKNMTRIGSGKIIKRLVLDIQKSLNNYKCYKFIPNRPKFTIFWELLNIHP